MNRSLLALFILSTSPAAAQARPAEQLINFNPFSVELRKVGERWQITAGEAVLKDFGAQGDEAREALRVIRELRLSQLVTIGAPRPVFEYWLCDGRAPAGLGRQSVRSFDTQKLKVEENQGQWFLRDASQILLALGSRRADAERALAVIQQHGFNRLGILGRPAPLMMYFLAAGDAGKQPPQDPQASPARPGLPAARQLGCDKPIIAGLEAEGRTPINCRQIEVRRDGQGWQLVAGEACLAVFALEDEARDAQRIVQQLRATDRYQIGDPQRPFTFFLINDQPPRGLPLGLGYRSFRADDLAVRGSGQDWFVCERETPLFRAGSTFSEAWQVLQALRKYKFDHVCWIGSAQEPALRFPVRAR